MTSAEFAAEAQSLLRQGLVYESSGPVSRDNVLQHGKALEVVFHVWRRPGTEMPSNPGAMIFGRHYTGVVMVEIVRFQANATAAPAAPTTAPAASPAAPSQAPSKKKARRGFVCDLDSRRRHCK